MNAVLYFMSTLISFYSLTTFYKLPDSAPLRNRIVTIVSVTALTRSVASIMLNSY